MRPNRVCLFILTALAATPNLATAVGPDDHGSCPVGPSFDAFLMAREGLARQVRGETGDLRGVLNFQEIGGYLTVEDDGTLVFGGHAFDLGGKSLRLTRVNATTFNASVEAAQYDSNIGALSATWSAYNSQAIAVSAPGFLFGATSRATLWATSTLGIYFSAPGSEAGCGDDPNCMQFLQSELEFDQSTPRIGVLERRDHWIWTPSVELYVNQTPSAVLLTWHQITSSVTSNPDVDMYFQARLEKSTGNILLTWPTATSVNSFGAVQVVTGNEPSSPITDLSALTTTPTAVDGPLMEAFTFGELLPYTVWDEVQARYPYGDANLDGLAIYQNFYTDLTFFAGAYHTNGQPGVTGIGNDGAKQTSLLHMNELYLSWNRVDERIISVLSHEFGHRWLYFIDGVGSSRSGAHPAMKAHLPAAVTHITPNDSSCMGGTTWIDNGNGTFTSQDYRTYYSYSWHELYLMGFAPSSEVQDWWYVGNNSALNGAYWPPVSSTYTGTRVDLDVNDIIAAEGPRSPAYPNTQRDFKVLFVLVTRLENPLRQLDIDKMTHITNLWPSAWEQIILGRGTMTAVFEEFLQKGDYDRNGDVDLADYPPFPACMTGPGGGVLSGCGVFDFNEDGDVDAADYAGFQEAS